jgi:quercetin dioxygenase-like cupin family protein
MPDSVSNRTLRRRTIMTTITVTKPVAVIAAILIASMTAPAAGQHNVERKGVVSKMRLEQVMSGHLTALNGKYKLQVSELAFEPGGSVSPHDHIGPGIRYVLSGEVTLVQDGTATTYKTGDYFYEAGNTGDAAFNKGNTLARVINFEIVPADWKGGSAVPPKK